MSTLIENYEQQYAILTADITAKIGQISNLTNHEKITVVQNTDKAFEEAQELLEQMELEVRSIQGPMRQHLKNRVESHKIEFKRLLQEFHNICNPNSQENVHEEKWENITDDQRSLLDTTEKLDRTKRNIQKGYSVAIETEEIGTQVLRDLHEQREVIHKNRGRLRETNAELGLGSRLMSRMIFRAAQQRIIIIAIFIILIFLMCSVLYFKVT